MAKEQLREIVEYECPKCGCKQSYKNISKYSIAGECVYCGGMTFYEKINKNNINIKPAIECPYCHSTNTKKISGMSKAGHVALFGIFSIGKVTKQWHCNNCKSDF